MPNIRDLKLGPTTINEFDYSTTFINEIDYGTKTVFLNGGGPQPGFGDILVADISPRSNTGGFHIEVSPGTYPNSYNPGTWVTLQSHIEDLTDTHLKTYYKDYTLEASKDNTRGSVHLFMNTDFSYYLGYIIGKNTTFAEAAEYWEQYESVGVISWAIRLGEVSATITPGYHQQHMRLDFLLDPESYVTNETTNQSAANMWDYISVPEYTYDGVESIYRIYAELYSGFPIISKENNTTQGTVPYVNNRDTMSSCSPNIEYYVPEVSNVQVTFQHYDYYLLNGVTPTQESLSEAAATALYAVSLESQLVVDESGAYSGFQETVTGTATIKFKKHTSDISNNLFKNSLGIRYWEDYSDVVESRTFNGTDLDIQSYIDTAIEDDVTVVVNYSRVQPTGYANPARPAYDQEGQKIGYFVDAPSINSPLGFYPHVAPTASFIIRSIYMSLRYHMSADNICTYVDIIEYDEENQDVVETDDQGNILYSFIYSPKIYIGYYKSWEKEYNQ